ncbi:ABC transporter permease [Clostridium grantii]|uniref:Ribose transport system permease protein n=1 Tax=Clostridium grantii DSM 8605 TaxID=1121316 RepID=A0A1M5SWW8_9CLOT|nr:ABC transporter permease [Clostridium grantii]SHH42718.1 ribose transport system permease protein [Clostridium grantii DSM 8605]
MKEIYRKRKFVIFSIIIFISFIISVKSPVFLTPENLLSLITNNIVLAIMSIGMTLIIIASGIDISVGSQLAVSAIIVGKFISTSYANYFTVFFVALSCGLILGFINGFIIAKAKISSIIITLGTMSMYRGLVMNVTKGKWITGLPDWFLQISRSKLLLVPIPIYILIIVIAITCFILKYTELGRNIYAVGSNPISATRAGVNISFVYMFVFCYMGLLTGLASILYSSELGSIQPNAGVNFELTVIASVVIGGANILGGSGTILGTLLGVILMGIVQNGLIIARIPTYFQSIVVGFIIVVTVSLDVIQRKRNDENLFVFEHKVEDDN